MTFEWCSRATSLKVNPQQLYRMKTGQAQCDERQSKALNLSQVLNEGCVQGSLKVTSLHPHVRWTHKLSRNFDKWWFKSWRVGEGLDERIYRAKRCMWLHRPVAKGGGKKMLHSSQPASLLHKPEYSQLHVKQRHLKGGFAFLPHAILTRKWLSTTPTPSPDKDNEIGWICKTAKSVAAAAQRMASAFKDFMFYLCTRIAGCLLLCRLYIIPRKS